MKYCYSLAEFEKLPDNTESLRLSLHTPDMFKILGRMAKHLRHLEIYNNVLTEIPDEIAQFTGLEQLHIYNMQNVEQVSPAMGELVNLKKLHFQSYNKLTSLPQEMEKLQQLVDFHLFCQRLKSVPDAVFKWKNLHSLILIGNTHGYYYKSEPIYHLPDELGNLHNLSHLALSGLGLTALPNVFARLTKLKKLFVNQNPLKELPESVSQLKSLTEVSFDANFFTVFPKPLLGCTALQSISLQQNKIATIPKEINNLQQLLRLQMNSNMLNKLPETITQLSQITDLMLERNQLRELPDISVMPKLQTLNINYNKITELPEYFKNLKIQRLFFEQNPFGQPPLFFLYWDYVNASNLQSVITLNRYRTNFYPRKFLDNIGTFVPFLNAKKIPHQHREVLYTLLCLLKKEQEKQPLEGVLHAFCNEGDIPLLLQNAQRWIEEKYAKEYKKNPLKKGVSVALMGNFTPSAEVVVQQTQQIGLTVSQHIRPDTTHAVLGYGIKVKEIASLLRQGLILVSRNQLTSFLEENNQLYLVEKTQSTEERSFTVENLAALLSSNDAQSVEVALEMMSSGGVPREVWTNLYWAASRFHLGSKKIAEQCRQLMRLYTHKRLVSMPVVNPKTFITKADWERIWNAVKSEILDWKVLEPLFMQNEIWYTNRYWLELEGEAQYNAIEAYIKANNYAVDARFFPSPHLLANHPSICKVSAIWQGWDFVPDSIFHLINLEELELRGNRLSYLPTDFEKLTKLHTINISSNFFKTFPEVFNKMPNLKTIYCEYNGFSNSLNTRIKKKQNINTIDADVYDLSALPSVITRK